MLPRIEITNWENWGLLVKSWATGENRLPGLFTDAEGRPLPHVPRPTTRADFEAQCAIAQVGVSIPDDVNAVHIIPTERHTITIKLPSAEMIKDSEAALEGGEAYVLPDCYSKYLKRKSETTPKPADPLGVRQADKQNFHNCRVGDYSIRQCM